MIQSMTGFGKAVVLLPNKKITVEIKSLNSKQLDINSRIAAIFREKELEIRNEISNKLERGKVDISVYTETIGTVSNTSVNTPLIENYKNQIENLAQNLNMELPTDWYSILLRMPDALHTETAELSDEDVDAMNKAVTEAISNLVEFRTQEGAKLEKFFTIRIEKIAALLAEVATYETERINKIKTRIVEALQKIENFDYDKNRFEQEMIYYIEKLDVNEEKNRLKSHLEYFMDTMKVGHGQGKKLGFITQEMGREINTLGSKSNHAEMQKIVVKMKDELEQIKEQVLNVM